MSCHCMVVIVGFVECRCHLRKKNLLMQEFKICSIQYSMTIAIVHAYCYWFVIHLCMPALAHVIGGLCGTICRCIDFALVNDKSTTMTSRYLPEYIAAIDCC